MPLLESFLSLFGVKFSANKSTSNGNENSNQPRTQAPVMSSAESGYPPQAPFESPRGLLISQKAEDQVLRYLDDRRDNAAEIDSSERFPPPKCHPYTRQKLLKRLSDWREDKRCDGNMDREMFTGTEANPDDDDELDNKTDHELLADAGVLDSHHEPTPSSGLKLARTNWNMLWVLGPAGVGKSALAQTFAEFCKKFPLAFLATFFFSRPNRRDDPSKVIPTLISQLMVQIPRYKKLIIRELASNPRILEKPVDVQFRELLVGPLDNLHSKQPFDRPILVVLDGLDECRGEEAQTEFIRLIGTHVQSPKNSPILWLVCSRPEWHLKQMFSHADFGVKCHRIYISPDDKDAKRDARIVLRFGLQDIRRQFSDRLPAEWPGHQYVRILSKGSRSLFIVVVTILSFVGDKSFGVPTERLKACVDAFVESERSGDSNKANPFAALDILYEQILNHIPPDVMSTAMQIICLRILYPNNDLSVSLHANVLGLDRERFYHVLKGMHSVLLIPPLEYADKYGIQFYHASFQDYLKDRARSKKYFLVCSTGNADVAAACLRWYDAIISKDCSQATRKCTLPLPPLSWPPDSTNNSLNERTVTDQVQDVVLKTAWDACCQVDSNDAPKVVEMFSIFHFCHLTSAVRNEQQLIPFFNWLYLRGDRKGVILRSGPSATSIAEIRLAMKIGVKIPLNVFPLRQTRHRIEFVSSHGEKKPSKREQAAAFFLGSGERACLVRILYDGNRNEQGIQRLSPREHALGSMKLRI